jgi:hypothetical protein
MSFEFSEQIETSIDSVGFDECFYSSINELRAVYAKLHGTEVADEVLYNGIKADFEILANSKNPEKGYVFSITSPDKTKYYAYFTARNEHGTAILNTVLFNQIGGSKNWTVEHAHSHEPLKKMLESIGAYRWRCIVPVESILSGFMTVTPYKGTVFGPERRNAGILLSNYGWD